MPITGSYTGKGGTGKTTITLSLGTCPNFRGRMILSMDPQMDIPYALGLLSSPDGARRVQAAATAFNERLHGREPQGAAYLALPDGGTLLVSNQSLDGVPADAIRRIMAPALNRPIFIDLPPLEGSIVNVGLNACDVIIVPVLLEELALGGLIRTIVTVRRLVQGRTPKIVVLRNRVQLRPDTAARSVHARLVEICCQHNVPLLKTIIRDRAVYRTAQNKMLSIWDPRIDALSSPAEARKEIFSLANELACL